jgi:limonene-1,2-epoxide hydrolase
VAPSDVVRAHIAAFNGGDLDGLIQGFSEAAVWATGTYRVAGRDALQDFFASAIRGLRPRLEILTIIAEGERVACELREVYTADGQEREAWIAGIYVVGPDGISRAKIYREGSADA